MRNILHLDQGACRQETCWEKISKNLTKIESISGWMKIEKGQGLPNGLCNLKHIKYLHIYGLFADWKLFENLASFKHLTNLKLHLTVMHVSFDRENALQFLINLQNLESLEITFRRYVILNKKQFQVTLYNLPNLKRLALRKCCFRDGDVSQIFYPEGDDNIYEEDDFIDESKPKLPLIELDLSGTLTSSSLDVKAMKQLNSLQVFRLQEHQIDEHIYYLLTEIFSNWPQLRCLDLRYADFPANVLKFLKNSNIDEIHLSLHGVEFPLEALNELSDKAEALIDLNLYDVCPGDAMKFYYLADWFPKLKKLKIHGDLGVFRESFYLEYLHVLRYEFWMLRNVKPPRLEFGIY